MLLSSGKIAPQAFAELSPQITDGYYYPTSVGIQLERNFAYYDALYRFQPWVRTVVDKIANAVARLTVRVWEINETDGNTIRTLDTAGPYARLIADPCAFLSPYQFWLWVASTIEMYGEVYLLKVRNAAGQVISLQPMHPSRVNIRRDGDTGDYIYQWTGSSGGIGLLDFAGSEVVPIQLFNPQGLERGLSRLESLRSTLFSEDASRNATAAMWRNAGRPNLVIESPNKQLSEDAFDRLKRQFDSLHAGSDNAGRTAILEHGMTARAIQLTAVEMQFIQSRQLNREEVAAVFDIAPPLIQILDRATFSNITAQLRAFYRDTMAPRLELIESALAKHLGSEFNKNKFAEFETADVLRGDYETRANAASQLVQVGVMKPSEGRELMGLNDAGDVADALYANSAIQPLGQPAERVSLSGEIAGPTPDGVNVIAVPSPTGGPAIAVPSPQQALPAPDVQRTAPAKYLRAIRGGMGRGEEIRSLAMKLADRNPEDLEDILAAVQIAIDERNSR